MRVHKIQARRRKVHGQIDGRLCAVDQHRTSGAVQRAVLDQVGVGVRLPVRPVQSAIGRIQCDALHPQQIPMHFRHKLPAQIARQYPRIVLALRRHIQIARNPIDRKSVNLQQIRVENRFDQPIRNARRLHLAQLRVRPEQFALGVHKVQHIRSVHQTRVADCRNHMVQRLQKINASNFCAHNEQQNLLVGHTRPTVRGQSHHMRTLASERVVHAEQTQMRTLTVRCTRTHVSRHRRQRLSARMHDLHAKRLRLGALNDRDVGAVPFVRSNHGVCTPIRPVHVILEHTDAKRMRQHLLIAQHQMMIVSIVVNGVYRIGACINPVDSLRPIVDGQAIRPCTAQLRNMRDNRALFAGHRAAFDARICTVPVRPEQQTNARIERNCARTLHVACYKSTPKAAVDARHFDLIQIAVHPVQIATDPVDGQTLGCAEARLYDSFDVLDGLADDGATVWRKMELQSCLKIHGPLQKLTDKSYHRSRPSRTTAPIRWQSESPAQSYSAAP